MTMRRYEGFLRGHAADPFWPARWWVVGVQMAPATDGASAGQRVRGLDRWSAVVMDYDGPKLTAHRVQSGKTVAEFWEALSSQGRIRGSTYVVSPRALMAWQLLGLWGMVERGSLKVSARGVPARLNESGRKECGEYGPLMVSDPPTAGVFTYVDTGTVFSWLCAGNFGLQPLSSGDDAAGESERLALRIRSSTAVLAAHGIGGWGVTAGAMALRGWRASYGGKPLYVSSGRSGDALEREAPAGGLLMARPTGETAVQAVSVDARSMYPWIAATCPQATNMRRSGIRGVEAGRAVNRDATSVLARVGIETPEPLYPQRTAAGVVYPIGSFSTVLCGPELELALRRGHLREVICANVYEMGTPTAEYQRRVYAARIACRAPEYEGAAGLIKRLGVSLIGKFAQKNDVWKECVPDISDPLWGAWTHLEWGGQRRDYVARAGVTQVHVGTELAPHALPSIPLWIWSYGRIRMRRWIERAGADEVYYCDTDGMILSPEGLDRLREHGLIYDDSWGMLRQVGGVESCIVYGLKRFTLGGRTVQGGKPLNQRQGGAQMEQAAWYRLPWDRLGSPEWGGSWVENLR